MLFLSLLHQTSHVHFKISQRIVFEPVVGCSVVCECVSMCVCACVCVCVWSRYSRGHTVGPGEQFRHTGRGTVDTALSGKSALTHSHSHTHTHTHTHTHRGMEICVCVVHTHTRTSLLR